MIDSGIIRNIYFIYEFMKRLKATLPEKTGIKVPDEN